MAVINYASKDKDSKEYIPLIAWKSIATYIVNYLNPGNLVSIKWRISSIGNQKGNQSFHFIVEEIRPLESKKIHNDRFLVKQNNTKSFDEDSKEKLLKSKELNQEHHDYHINEFEDFNFDSENDQINELDDFEIKD